MHVIAMTDFLLQIYTPNHLQMSHPYLLESYRASSFQGLFLKTSLPLILFFVPHGFVFRILLL
eukprot:c43222_g1_i1 orf=75-263(+)